MIHRGDVWSADLGFGPHPVVVVTREEAIPVLTSLACVAVSSTIRGHRAEVLLGRPEGLRHESAANCDGVATIPAAAFTRYRGRLGAPKLWELDRALRLALGLT